MILTWVFVVVFNVVALPWIWTHEPLLDPQFPPFQILDFLAFGVPTVLAFVLPEFLDNWTGGFR